MAERTDWETGKTDLKPMGIRYSPQALVRRLSPASMDIGDALVKAMAVVGALFLVVYCVALVLGLMLARSITRSIHGLSVGTERLRQGDFAHPIPIHSRDQLGELAESFNVMAHGIQDLLREQAEKERLEEELRIARQIQMSLLPQDADTPVSVQVDGQRESEFLVTDVRYPNSVGSPFGSVRLTLTRVPKIAARPRSDRCHRSPRPGHCRLSCRSASSPCPGCRRSCPGSRSACSAPPRRRR